MKKYLVVFIFIVASTSQAQSTTGSEQFWNKLKAYCGQSFEGQITAGATANDPFSGKKLLMHVKSCEENRIRIPFYVGDDKSRTWVLTLNNDVTTLKHDHRLEDGTPDKVTQYGGTSSNAGLADIQFFPADQETCDLIGYASTNVWWITVDEKSFTYNLKRIGSDRIFSVSFDTTKPVKTPAAPWGWAE